jgi:hypothetical protein
MAKGEQGEMMTEIDLIERLRKQSDPEHRLFDTAADEIERLQKIKDRLNAECDTHVAEIMRLQVVLDACILSNKELRAALEQIANLRPGYRFPDARDIAREALL